MSTHRMLLSATVLLSLVTACAASATPTQIAQSPRATLAPVQDGGGMLAPRATAAPPPALEAPQPTAAADFIGGGGTNGTSGDAYAPRLPAPTNYPLPAPTPGDMYFQNPGVNPFVDPLEEHLSTFALDVDTASYTLARRYVQQGSLPPADAVRVEEFVNFFKQDYPLPPDIAFGLYADGAPSPFQSDGTYLLRLGVQGYSVPEGQRQPAALTFVIDVSGSMGMDNRLGLVKQALRLLVDRLGPQDTVAIVVFGSDARVVLNPTQGADRGAVLDVIDSLRTEGSTNTEDGLRLGYQLAQQGFRPGAVNRVILCSDGVANVGATDAASILAAVGASDQPDITLTTMGFGMGNFNDVLMEQLADQGHGQYAYIDTLEEARRLFVDNLTSTIQVIAKDAKVQVDFNAEVVSRYRLVGYENRALANQDFRNDAVTAGEIGAGHTVTALYAVQLRPGAQGRLVTMQMRWQDPQDGRVREINGNVNTWDLAARFEASAPRYQLTVAVAQYAELLRHSPWARGSSLAQVSRLADRLAEQLPGDPAVWEFAQLVRQAWQIAGE